MKKKAIAKPMTPATAGPLGPFVSGVVRNEMIQNANITLMTTPKRAQKTCA